MCVLVNGDLGRLGEWSSFAFTFVDEFVLFQGKASSEGLVTDVALESFHFGVSFLMRLQIADLAEGSSTNIALVWFLSWKIS